MMPFGFLNTSGRSLPPGCSRKAACRFLQTERDERRARFQGTRVLAQTLIEYLKAGDSIDDFLEGFPSVTREQVIAFLEETKAREPAYSE